MSKDRFLTALEAVRRINEERRETFRTEPMTADEFVRRVKAMTCSQNDPTAKDYDLANIQPQGSC